MHRATFDRICTLVYEKSGIALSQGKETLVSSRLAKRMRTLNIVNHEDYLDFVLEHEKEGELTTFLDAICTNFTNFFREPTHFDFFKDIFANWIAAGQTKFRVWSAASSTGEEPYSLGISMLETAHGKNLDMRILATDLSSKVLAIAKKGCYHTDRVQPIPLALRKQYFQHNKAQDIYTVKDSVRQLLSFKRLNLSQPPFPMHGPLDVVFCRNVMIYFDNEVRKRLINEIYRLLRPGGYLMVGHSESLTGLTQNFETCQPSVYKKVK